MLAREHPRARPVLNELERLADSYEAACGQAQQNLTIAESFVITRRGWESRSLMTTT